MKRYWKENRLKDILNNVQCHEKVFEEIADLVIKKGISEQFVKLLEKNMTLIRELGIGVTRTSNFEVLKKTEGLYSMKFKGKNMNLRMLYSYDFDRDILFLHCFYEKSDSKKYRYDDHVPIALSRKKEMEEDYEK